MVRGRYRPSVGVGVPRDVGCLLAAEPYPVPAYGELVPAHFLRG